MRKSFLVPLSIAAFIFSVVAWSPANAQCTYPNSFSNGQPADASQVMGNFYALSTSCAPLASPTFTGTLTGVTGTFSGNIGVQATLSAWRNTFAAEQLGQGAAVTGQPSTNFIAMSSNWYQDSGGNEKYITSDYATRYYQFQGTHRWEYAPSGSAGGTITWAEASRIDLTGNYLVGMSAATLSGGASRKEIGLSGSADAAYTLNVAGVLQGFLYASTTVTQLKNSTSSPIDIIAGSNGVELVNGATSWAAISDERMKRWDIPQIDYEKAIRALWVGDYRLFRDFTKTGTAKPMFGVRAQQAFNVLPADVRDMTIHRGDAKKPWTAAAEPMAYLALWGDKRLLTITDKQDVRIKALEVQVRELQVQNGRLLAAQTGTDAQVKGLAKIVARLQHANDNRGLKTASR